MIRRIFVNLPGKALDKPRASFKAIGFSFNPQLTDKTAALMVMSDDIHAMLPAHNTAKEFAKKRIADAHDDRCEPTSHGGQHARHKSCADYFEGRFASTTTDARVGHRHELCGYRRRRPDCIPSWHSDILLSVASHHSTCRGRQENGRVPPFTERNGVRSACATTTI